MNPPANRNALWAGALVDELVRGGVTHAVVCPGSRSTPLALACAADPRLRVWSVIDERSAGFFALGLAKASGHPALIVVTSGSAGSHLLPAVTEAAQSGTPMVVLTADRPTELHGFGAPQTMPQADLFGGFARAFVDLGLPEPSDDALIHLRAVAARAVATARSAPRGAVQLNVPFREPLAPIPEPLPTLSPLATSGRPDGAPFLTLVSPRGLDHPVLEQVADRLRTMPRGLIVCGPRPEADGLADAALRLSERTGYPILAESASNLRFGPAPDLVISLYDPILRHAPFADAHRPDLVVRIGGGLTSKVLQQWLDATRPETILFSHDGFAIDPTHLASTLIVGDPTDGLTGLSDRLKEAAPSPDWSSDWHRADVAARRALAETDAAEEWLTEPHIARAVVAALPEGTALVVSSSMPIRDVDWFAPADGIRRRVIVNRGVNGIDGLPSTALGVAAAAGGPTLLLTGDLSLIHDMGGLLTGKRAGLSLVVVVVNNDGGGIFSYLPVAGTTDAFEPLFGTAHGLEFAHLAALFGARFVRPTTADGLTGAIRSGLDAGGLHLIEVRTDRATGPADHHRRYAAVAKALSDDAQR